MNIKIAFFILSIFSMSVLAKPAPLVIDSAVSSKSSDKYINAVHKEIPVDGNSINKTRYKIFEGMLRTKGFAWVYEGEGDGYILARFDYRGDTNVIRIEYDEQYVQLKYHAALGDFVCKNLIEDICYKNNKGYYKYIKNLRRSIYNELSR